MGSVDGSEVVQTSKQQLLVFQLFECGFRRLQFQLWKQFLQWLIDRFQCGTFGRWYFTVFVETVFPFLDVQMLHVSLSSPFLDNFVTWRMDIHMYSS